jgi:hypothetical protein
MTKRLILLMLVALSIPLVAAFGVVTPYWKENPLVMQPGEAKDVQFNLQNMIGSTDYNIRVNLMNNSGIAIISDSSTDYLVRAKSADVYVNMKIKIPANATIGTIYPITLSFATISSGEGGVSLGTSIEKSFEVIVGQKIEKPGIPIYVWIIAAIAAIAVIIIITLLIKSKKKKRK